MNLKFSGVLAVFQVHVCAEFHYAVSYHANREKITPKETEKQTVPRGWKQYCRRYCGQ